MCLSTLAQSMWFNDQPVRSIEIMMQEETFWNTVNTLNVQITERKVCFFLFSPKAYETPQFLVL